MLTDEQCDEFRRLPCSFNNMIRSVYQAGAIDSILIIKEETPDMAAPHFREFAWHFIHKISEKFGLEAS